jgi:hypothetical protein
MNKYFCKDCNINLCEKYFNDFKCLKNKHTSWYLDDIKKICSENIKEIKTILNKNIIRIKDDDKMIKKIIQYTDKYIINNNIENDSNLINEEFSLMKNIENKDILLINQIILVNYINYFHYKNIEDILRDLKDTYNINDNGEYKGCGKMIYENGDYYIGQWKDNLRHGKGIIFYNYS